MAVGCWMRFHKLISDPQGKRLTWRGNKLKATSQSLAHSRGILTLILMSYSPLPKNHRKSIGKSSHHPVDHSATSCRAGLRHTWDRPMWRWPHHTRRKKHGPWRKSPWHLDIDQPRVSANPYEHDLVVFLSNTVKLQHPKAFQVSIITLPKNWEGDGRGVNITLLFIAYVASNVPVSQWCFSKRCWFPGNSPVRPGPYVKALERVHVLSNWPNNPCLFFKWEISWWTEQSSVLRCERSRCPLVW